MKKFLYPYTFNVFHDYRGLVQINEVDKGGKNPCVLGIMNQLCFADNSLLTYLKIKLWETIGFRDSNFRDDIQSIPLIAIDIRLSAFS